MKTLFEVYTTGLSSRIPLLNKPKDSFWLWLWRDPVLHSVLEFVVRVTALPFQMFFSGDQTLGNHRATCPGCRVDGQAAPTWTQPVLRAWPWKRAHALSWSRTTPYVSSLDLLFLMDLRRFRSVPQYISELMVRLCSRISTSSRPGMSKKTGSNTLPADAMPLQFLGGGEDACFHCMLSCFVSGS